MPTYRANKRQGETHDIPDDEEIVSQETVAGVEIIETEEAEEFECMDPDCDRVFDSERGMETHHRQVHEEG